MARKKGELTRCIRITLRYSFGEFSQINGWASSSGLCIAHFVRLRTLGFTIKPRLTAEETNFYRQLTGMANNLNQLTRSANSGEEVQDQIKFQLQTIDKLLAKII